jgi:hypothetical protein
MTSKVEKEADLLARAMLRQIAWREYKMQLKQQAKIKRMLRLGLRKDNKHRSAD